MTYNRLSFYSTTFLILCMALASCNMHNQEQTMDTGISVYNTNIFISRAAKDEEMLKSEILEPVKIKDFKGLQYFDPDSTYRVMAKIQWVEKEKVIFSTNTERSPVYYTFCKLHFKIGDSLCTLIAYAEDADGKTGLFIPFNDRTNTHETYGGGRYLEVPYRGEKDLFELDFNLAFNPYCHYNHGYSCPLVPAENRLHVPIKAGEKKLYE